MKVEAFSSFIPAILVFVVIVVSLFTSGCAETFLVSKDCKTYFFGSNEEVLHYMLCETGDFRRILAATDLSDDLREKLFASQCVDRSYEAAKALYSGMTHEQKGSLKYAFWKQGYQINIKPLDNYQFNYLYTAGTEFCPTERAW